MATISWLSNFIIEKTLGLLYYTITTHLALLNGQIPASLHRNGLGTIFATLPDYFSKSTSGSHVILLYSLHDENLLFKKQKYQSI